METIYDEVSDPETLDSTLPFANPSLARAVPHDFAQHRFSLDFPELAGSTVKVLDNREPLLATHPYSSPKERSCYLYNDRVLYSGVYPATPRSNVHNAPSTTDTAAIKYDQAGQAIKTANATNIRHDHTLLDNNNKRDFLDWNIDPPANKSSDAGDTSDKQETFTPTTNRSLYTQGSVGSFLGFLHGRHNYPRRSRSPSSLYPSSISEDSVDPQVSTALSPPAQKKAPSHNVYNPGFSAPIPIQPQLVSPSSKQPWRKAPTPPPSLLSPSLTTTKVSRSLSTERGIAGSGSLQSQTTHPRKDSRSGNIFIGAGNVDSTTIPLPLSPCNNPVGLRASIDPDPPCGYQHAPDFVGEPKDVSPPACSCVEHYRYAILSTIVPLPLDLCFEWLYSAQGLGHGDQLLRKAHNTVNSSLHIDVSPWTKSESENYVTETNEWETKTRRLHYTVTFKIPMLAKTSTMCHEIQEVLEHNTHSVRLHSESTTPNVIYGDVFSTVNQVCMTREPTGMTRIKCFAEVKFKKSILWSSRIEASAMEGCSLYYKELLRQLMELDSTSPRQPLLVRPSIEEFGNAEGAQAGVLLRCTSTPANSAPSQSGATMTLEVAPAMTRSSSSSSQGFIGISPAHSLLAQQYLRNPPTISKVAQISTISANLYTDPITISSNNSTNKTIQTDSTSPSSLNRSTGVLWASFMKKSVEFLLGPLSIVAPNTQDHKTTPSNQDSSNRGHAEIESSGDPTQIDLSLAATDGSASLPTTNADSSHQELPATRTASNSVLELLSEAAVSTPARPELHIRAINRSLWIVLVLTMTMSVLNLWYLFRTVSSMAAVIHINHQDRQSRCTDPACSAGTGIQQLSLDLTLLPIGVQADMLRSEMDILAHLLQAVQSNPP